MIKILLLSALTICYIYSWFQVGKLRREYKEYEGKIQNASTHMSILEQHIQDKKNEVELISNNLTEKQEEYSSYCSEMTSTLIKLRMDYDSENTYWNDRIEKLKREYGAEYDETLAEIDKAKRMRAALIQANLKQKELDEKEDFYKIKVLDLEKADMATLEQIKPMLKNPRILSMLIWQSFIQKPFKVMVANVLGERKVTGIYKITSTVTNMCYIGQAKDMAKRWSEHLKAACGIDTPNGNKLYAAMKEEGIWNFTFELLEECPPEELNEKERLYIEIYDSYNYGYNSNQGIKGDK